MCQIYVDGVVALTNGACETPPTFGAFPVLPNTPTHFVCLGALQSTCVHSGFTFARLI